jgi:hypothetical protein
MFKSLLSRVTLNEVIYTGFLCGVSIELIAFLLEVIENIIF